MCRLFDMQVGEPCIPYENCQEYAYKKVQYVVKLAYRLLMMMVRGNTHFAMQLYPYLPFMQSQLSHGFDITWTMMEIFRDNEAVLYQINDQVSPSRCSVHLLGPHIKPPFRGCCGSLCGCRATSKHTNSDGCQRYSWNTQRRS